MDVNSVLTALFGAGGAGALAGIFALINTLRKGKLENEETLIVRLNNDSKQQGARADKAETDLVAARRAFEEELATMRRQRDRARDRASELRSHVMSLPGNHSDLPTLDDLYA